MKGELADLDATAHAELVRMGEASPEELVEAAIRRVDAVNDEINAVIHPLFEEALEAARSDLPDGPFRGVPFVLKDLGAALAGQPYHMGMQFLKDRDFHAPADTYLARRFRDAGFVTIGKTNTPELGILPTTEPKAYGPSRNPWDTECSTGGSSGGSGAAVASGMVPVAHANDGGGSIRIPASECGLVGLKPTRQRISAGPLVGDSMGGLTTEFVVSRSVRDTAAILDAVQGAAPGDPYVAPPPARPYIEELGADAALRVGLWTDPLSDFQSDPAVIAAAEEAARTLESLGHSVDQPDLSEFDNVDLIPTFLIRWAAGQGAIVDQLGRISGRPIREDEVEPLTWALAEKGRSDSAGDFLRAVSGHQRLTRRIADLYETRYDLLLTPTLTEPPPPLGTFDDSGPDPTAAVMRGSRTGAFTALANVTGQPAISLPTHLSEAGLPLGIQLIAAYGREDLLIRVAAQLEQALPWADRRPGVFASEAAIP